MDNIQNYIDLANMSFESKQYNEAVNYYLKAIEIQPTNYYLHFRKSLAIALQISPLEVKARTFVVSAEKYIETAEDSYKVKKEVFSEMFKYYKEAKKALEDYATPLRKAQFNAAMQNLAARPVWNQDNTNISSFSDYLPILLKCNYELLECGHQLITRVDCTNEILNDEFKNIYCNAVGAVVCCRSSELEKKYPKAKTYVTEVVNCYNKYAKTDHNQEYFSGIGTNNYYFNKEMGDDGNTTGGTMPTSSGCCYVATAIYGSYDCPQVWTLRRFRDNKLSKTWYGRSFVYVYYAISPTFIKLFGHTKWFNKFFRKLLDNMIEKLRNKGYESTPYNDKKW
ncbi:MAG: hypothetical protein IJA34_12580 [Lachnospiraceae bacterium]|nr:hypothetical protein [Lachnospiraceae bacterium]